MSNLTQVLLAQEMPQESSPIAGLIVLVIAVFLIASLWKTFTKAGKPGWGAIISIYNVILLLQIAGRPIWWIVLMIIPVVNFVVAIIVSIDVAKNFGKGTGFGVGLALLGFIFFPILAFGDAQYQPQSQA
jgi:putative flippase GtrA